MITYEGGAVLEGEGRVNVHESPPDTINRIFPAQGTPEIAFTVSPQGPPFTYLIGTDVFIGPNKTPAEVEVTFTASSRWPKGLGIIQYRKSGALQYEWDFGDGTIGYGNPVTHIYKIASDQIRVTLMLLDNRGNRYFVGKQLYVEALSQANIEQSIAVTV